MTCRAAQDAPLATLPWTLGHVGILGRRAAFRLLPADDILVRWPLSVVGLGHGPGGRGAAAVSHDVDCGRVQGAGAFGTVRQRASRVAGAAGEKDRRRLQRGAGTSPPHSRARSCPASGRDRGERGRDGAPGLQGLHPVGAATRKTGTRLKRML